MFKTKGWLARHMKSNYAAIAEAAHAIATSPGYG